MTYLDHDDPQATVPLGPALMALSAPVGLVLVAAIAFLLVTQ